MDSFSDCNKLNWTEVLKWIKHSTACAYSINVLLSISSSLTHFLNLVSFWSQRRLWSFGFNLSKVYANWVYSVLTALGKDSFLRKYQCSNNTEPRLKQHFTTIVHGYRNFDRVHFMSPSPTGICTLTDVYKLILPLEQQRVRYYYYLHFTNTDKKAQRI